MIKKYSTKPEVVEAVQFKGTSESFCEIREWAGEKFYYDYQNAPGVFLINTDNRHLPVNKNDIVFKGENGFSVLKPDTFHATYSEEK